MSHWSSGLPICFPSQGTWVQNPKEDLCETGILLSSFSRYIGDPDVIDNFCGLVWGRLRPEPSLGPRADNLIIPLDLTQLFYPGFTFAAGSPSGFTTDAVGCWGGSPVESLQSHYILTMSHWSIPRDPGSKPQGGLMWNRDSPVSVLSLQFFACEYLKLHTAVLPNLLLGF